jgi:hypothetical protein
MPLILGTNSIKDVGFEVANSLRFNSGSSDRLTRSFSAGTTSLWTWSGWIKRSKLGSRQSIFTAYSSSSNVTRMEFTANDELKFNDENGGNTNGRIVSTAKYRDPSAWLHIVFHWDSSDGTSSDRLRMYVNNVRVTDFSDTGNAPTTGSRLNTAMTHEIGSENNGTFFEGYMAEVCFIDNANLDPDQFGEYDEDTNIWKPKDVSGLSFGTTGFYLDFEDSSALGNDVSGNNNDWTVSNLTSIDQSTDTCTNNFNTPNPLWGMQSIRVPTFAEGNLKITGDGDAQHHQTMGTFAFNTGKWFWEAKFAVSADIGKNKIGIMSTELGSPQTAELGDQSGSCLYVNEDGGDFRRDNATVDQNAGTFSHNQIISIALNMDDGEISIYKAGSLIVDALSIGNASGTFVTPASMHYRDAGMEFNFGSPPYSESGGNSDGNGYGNFSMSVPSGYFAINSKNLAEYG